MIPALSTHRPAIEALCHRFHVRRLDVFGSAARDSDFTHTSDIDLLVEFEADHEAPSLNEFFGLRDELAALLEREVDLTMASAIRNPFLRSSIERSRVALHGA